MDKILKRKSESTQSDAKCTIKVKKQKLSKEKVIRTVSKEIRDCLDYYYYEGVISGEQYVKIQSSASTNLIKRWIVNKIKIQMTVKI